MTGRGANGPVCCDMRWNSKTWMSHCGTLSGARAASTDARRGLPGASGEVGKVAQHVCSAERQDRTLKFKLMGRMAPETLPARDIRAAWLGIPSGWTIAVSG